MVLSSVAILGLAKSTCSNGGNRIVTAVTVAMGITPSRARRRLWWMTWCVVVVARLSGMTWYTAIRGDGSRAGGGGVDVVASSSAPAPSGAACSWARGRPTCVALWENTYVATDGDIGERRGVCPSYSTAGNKGYFGEAGCRHVWLCGAVDELRGQRQHPSSRVALLVWCCGRPGGLVCGRSGVRCATYGVMLVL